LFAHRAGQYPGKPDVDSVDLPPEVESKQICAEEQVTVVQWQSQPIETPKPDVEKSSIVRFKRASLIQIKPRKARIVNQKVGGYL
jgi:hypothetical protein